MKQRRSGMAWSVVCSLAIGMVGIGMVAIGCSSESSDPPSEPASGSEASSGPATLEAGGMAVCEELEVTLLTLRRTDVHTKTPKEGHGYAVLRFRVKNVGEEEEFGLIGRDLQWKDPATSMRNGPETYTGVPTDNPENLDLAPGAEAEFEDVYLFPEAMTEVEFHYLEGYDPQAKAVWKIAVE